MKKCLRLCTHLNPNRNHLYLILSSHLPLPALSFPILLIILRRTLQSLSFLLATSTSQASSYSENQPTPVPLHSQATPSSYHATPPPSNTTRTPIHPVTQRQLFQMLEVSRMWIPTPGCYRLGLFWGSIGRRLWVETFEGHFLGDSIKALGGPPGYWGV